MALSALADFGGELVQLGHPRVKLQMPTNFRCPKEVVEHTGRRGLAPMFASAYI